MKTEILYKGKYFNVIEKEENNASVIGIDEHNENVIVLPYTLTELEEIESIGVLNEFNTLRYKNYSITCITGDIEDDEDALKAAKRELQEESGFNQEDNNKWIFLGNLTTSKLSTQEHPCFAVDISGLKQNNKKGDGSKNEELSQFKLLTLDKLILEEDCFVLSMLMKLFVKKYGDIFR